MCKFISIPIYDFEPPTPENLIDLWCILDHFNLIRLYKHNVLMHCSAGHGRTGFMIASYIWLKKINIDETFRNYSNNLIEILKELEELEKSEEFKELTEKHLLLNVEIKKLNNYLTLSESDKILINIKETQYNEIKKKIINQKMQFYYKLTDNKMIKFLIEELKKYSKDSAEEVFIFDHIREYNKIEDSIDLLIQRIKSFMNAYKRFQLLNNSEKELILKKYIGELTNYKIIKPFQK